MSTRLTRPLRQESIEVQAIPPLRGSIFDRKGGLLADNQPIASLSIVRERVADVDNLIQVIGDLVGISEREVHDFKQRLKRSRKPFASVTLKESLTEKQVAILELTLIVSRGLRSIQRFKDITPLENFLHMRSAQCVA
ncbi:MAG: hypothetical protein CM1200mP24_05760 [Gammaproteobacteria bacterium]|nr:MAG: hypothetical protein CM1200mP24_05760 [Gammaproteobacteria bacterium]